MKLPHDTQEQLEHIVIWTKINDLENSLKQQQQQNYQSLLGALTIVILLNCIALGLILFS
jgi:hypothetical protein